MEQENHINQVKRKKLLYFGISRSLLAAHPKPCCWVNQLNIAGNGYWERVKTHIRLRQNITK